MAKPKILFVGFAVVDFIDDLPYLGGAAGAMSLNATQIGITSSLFAPLSTDSYGQLYKRELDIAKVNYQSCDFSSPHLPTCIIKDRLGLGSTRNWQDNGALEHFLKMSIPVDLGERYDNIFLCNAWTDIAENIAKSLERRSIFYIPGPKTVSNPEWIRAPILDKTLIVFCNKEESPSVWQHNPFSHGVELVVTTAGSEGGSVHLANGQVIRYQAMPINHVVDPTGAGDAWSLGFAVKWLQTHDIIPAIHLGNKLSSVCIQTKGAILPI